jgi:hypothetical protein
VLAIPSEQHPDVKPLSQRARLAIALHLFRGYCSRRGLAHPEIDRLLAHLWEAVGFWTDGEAFGRWVKREPPLVYAGLGDPYPTGFEEALRSAAVPAAEFQDALSATTEVLYISMYGAADEERSRQFLYELATTATAWGVEWPDIRRFAGSRWADGHGWGNRLTVQELAEWRLEPGR